MTASNERDLHEARTALHGSGSNSFTAIQGRIEGGKVSNRLLRIKDLPVGDWGKREQLTAEIRARFADSSRSESQTKSFESNEPPCSPFLYAVNLAMRDRTGSCKNRFLHNGKVHYLRTTSKSATEPGVIELEGRIQNEAR